MYLKEDAKIYDNVIAALEAKVISKLGNPKGWDETTYRTKRYPEANGKFGLRIGVGS